MEFIKITKENLESEHICCAISNNRDIQVISKKSWLEERLDEGLVFLKANVRGKCFIEYIPAEYAWAPIEADGFMYIDCLWVSGQFKGHGYSNCLLEACIKDSKVKGKKGLVALSSKKKAGFLADPKYLRHKGFVLADTADPYFELLYLPFEDEDRKPKFRDCAKSLVAGSFYESSICSLKNEKDPADDCYVIYYTNQCPFTAKYVPLLEETAKKNGVQLRTVHIASRMQAQNAPSPFTTFSLFYGREFITHEILSEKKFEKIITDRDS